LSAAGAGINPRFTLKGRAFMLLILVLFSGCAAYRAMPLTAKAVEAGLEVPAEEELRVRAASLGHPILKPVDLDISDGVSPDEAAVLAVIINPRLRAERDRKGVAGAEVLKAGILPNPRLSYSFELPVGGTKPNTVNAYGLGLGWDIRALVSREAKLSAARSRLESVALEIAWKEWQVAEKAKLGLYLYAIARERAALATEREKTERNIYALTKRAVRLGVKTSPELMRTRSALEEARSSLIKARADLEEKRLGLNSKIGLPAKTSITPEKTSDLWEFKAMPPAGSLVEGIEDRRLDIRALGLGYKSQEARLRAAVLVQFPPITIGPRVARDTDGLKTAGGLLDVEIPLFDRNQGTIALERATRKRLFDEYIARIFEARSEVTRLSAELASTASRIEQTRAVIKKMKDLDSDLEKAMKSGALDALDYYRFLTSLESKRLVLLDLEEEMAIEAVSLETASGRYVFSKDEMKMQHSKITKKWRH